MEITNKRKLAIIGANDFQNQLIIKAKKRGFETHVFAWKEGAVGEKTADFFYPISITEKEAILEECRRIQPEGVISIGSDLAAITVNYVAEKMGLTGNGIESSELATNKYLMRKAFEQNGDPSPKNYRSDELTETILAKMKFPLIVKPVDRSGSRGITRVECREELQKAIKLAEEVSFEKKAMVEEYVQGQEYSVEYISYKGKHTFLAITQKFTTGAPHFIETGHLQPASMEDVALSNVKKIVEHALNTLKIENGASHSEIKIDEQGKVVIIEIGGRMGGDCIGSDLVQLSTGYDFVNMVIDVACGEAPVFEKICEPTTARIDFIFGPEDMNRIQKMKEECPEQIYRISEIEEFDGHPVIDSGSRYGYIITRSK